MSKILTALVAAATIGGAALATSAPANAWRGGWGWGWGLGVSVAKTPQLQGRGLSASNFRQIVAA